MPLEAATLPIPQLVTILACDGQGRQEISHDEAMEIIRRRRESRE